MSLALRAFSANRARAPIGCRPRPPSDFHLGSYRLQSMPDGPYAMKLEAEHPLQEAVAHGESWVAECREPADLVRACSLLRRQAATLYEEGLRSDVLTRTVARWNDAVLRRLLEIHHADFADLDWCWLALGSEGREEQTVHTDQDNALIFRGEDAAVVRERLLPRLREINEQLDQCGYMLCPGDVMASNPKWCLSLEEWQDTFATWIDTGDPQALLHGAIFFDFRGIAGNLELARELREWLIEYIKPRPLFLKQMAEYAISNAPPLWPWKQLRVRKSDGEKVIDIKVNGVSMFVDAARVFSLASGVISTHTDKRFVDSAKLASESRDRRAWVAAYRSLQDLRVRHQFEQLAHGQRVDNRVRLDDLSRFEREVLVAAMQEAKRMQASLRLRYLL